VAMKAGRQKLTMRSEVNEWRPDDKTFAFKYRYNHDSEARGTALALEFVRFFNGTASFMTPPLAALTLRQAQGEGCGLGRPPSW